MGYTIASVDETGEVPRYTLALGDGRVIPGVPEPALELFKNVAPSPTEQREERKLALEERRAALQVEKAEREAGAAAAKEREATAAAEAMEARAATDQAVAQRAAELQALAATMERVAAGLVEVQAAVREAQGAGEASAMRLAEAANGIVERVGSKVATALDGLAERMQACFDAMRAGADGHATGTVAVAKAANQTREDVTRLCGEVQALAEAVRQRPSRFEARKTADGKGWEAVPVGDEPAAPDPV